jgi:hypothetical protein
MQQATGLFRQHKLGGFFPDNDAGSHCVSDRDLRKHGSIRNTTSLYAMDPQ